MEDFPSTLSMTAGLSAFASAGCNVEKVPLCYLSRQNLSLFTKNCGSLKIKLLKVNLYHVVFRSFFMEILSLSNMDGSVPKTHRLQNQTRTTSFSMHKESASIVISSEFGFGFWRNAFSNAILTVVSIDVRFFLRRPMASGVACADVSAVGFASVESASSNHFWRSGFSLHIFLKDKFKASNREIVVCEKSLPYSFPIARPTSPWVKPREQYKNCRCS